MPGIRPGRGREKRRHEIQDACHFGWEWVENRDKRWINYSLCPSYRKEAQLPWKQILNSCISTGEPNSEHLCLSYPALPTLGISCDESVLVSQSGIILRSINSEVSLFFTSFKRVGGLGSRPRSTIHPTRKMAEPHFQKSSLKISLWDVIILGLYLSW